MSVPRGQTPERAAYMKAWNAANPRDRRAYKKVYDTVHKEKITAYRVSIREHHKETNAAWYQANKEKILARVKARYVEKREQLVAYGREYYADNSDQMKANVSRRKAKLRGADGSHTLAEWRAKCVEFNRCCAYCGEAKPLTRDHVVAVANGGSDYIDNIVPACAPCNSRKRTRSAEEFGRTNHQKIGGVQQGR